MNIRANCLALQESDSRVLRRWLQDTLILACGLLLVSGPSNAQLDSVATLTLTCPIAGASEAPSKLYRIETGLLPGDRLGRHLQVNRDGSRLLALQSVRSRGDFLVMRMDGSWQIEWAIVAGGPHAETPYAVTTTSNDAVVVVGDTVSRFPTPLLGPSDDYPHGFAIALAPNGASQWASEFRIPNTQELYLNDVSPTQDGGVLLGGQFHVRFPKEMGLAVLARLKPDGTVEWASTWGNEPGFHVQALLPGANGHHIALAETWEGFDSTVAAIDESGKVAWATRIRFPDKDRTVALAAPDDGALLSRTLDDGRLFATRVSANGELIWSREYLVEGGPFFLAGASATDGGYLFLGGSDATEPRGEFYTLRLDADGNPMQASVVALQPYFLNEEPKVAVAPIRTVLWTSPDPNGGFALAGNLLMGTQKDIAAIAAGKRVDRWRIKQSAFLIDLDRLGRVNGCSKPVAVSTRNVPVPEHRAVELEMRPIEQFGKAISSNWPLVDLLNHQRLKVGH
jgi:hypothetical protein